MWFALTAGLLLLLAGVWPCNRLVAERNLARQGYADIDVQLKRHADLVPQLVEAVRGYANYEKALFATVTELRGNALAAQSSEARFALERQLGERLHQYLGVAEKDDLARMELPPQTPEEFAKFLPYAVALGVAKTWTDRFTATLGAAAVAAAVADCYVSCSGGGGGSGW